jgi:hypothetical protein
MKFLKIIIISICVLLVGYSIYKNYVSKYFVPKPQAVVEQPRTLNSNDDVFVSGKFETDGEIHFSQRNPTLFIHSSVDPEDSSTQWFDPHTEDIKNRNDFLKTFKDLLSAILNFAK